MKRILLLGLVALAPVALFASEGAETNYDIVQRTVNFIIFAAILWYLLADKIKAFLANRTLSIQSELDKVQETLKASQDKVADAQKKLEEAKNLLLRLLRVQKLMLIQLNKKLLLQLILILLI